LVDLVGIGLAKPPFVSKVCPVNLKLLGEVANYCAHLSAATACRKKERAGAVRDYHVQQGVPANSVTATGFGNTLSVASNDSPSGREENRRVEVVVSGESIGNDVNVTAGSLQ